MGGRAGRPDREQGGAAPRRADTIPIPRRGGTIIARPGRIRDATKPLDILQKDGPSFSVDGWKGEWQTWSFHVAFTAPEGLVLRQISYRDRGRERPIFYRASITEMVVPYADPTANRFWKGGMPAVVREPRAFLK